MNLWCRRGSHSHPRTTQLSEMSTIFFFPVRVGHGVVVVVVVIVVVGDGDDYKMLD